MRLEHKAAAAVNADAGLLDADDDTGVVEAIVSVTGVIDSDNDIIEPGVYAETLARRKPKGIFGHDWQKWSSRTEAIEEWLPGDPRLPKKTRDGKPWPAEAGALYVKTRYNLGSDTGRNAYSDVKFYSETGECEWSIGYRVPKGKGVRGKDGVRRIKGIDLFEYSPVLFGANSLSGTLAVKSAGDVDGNDDDYEPIDAVSDAEGLDEEDIAAIEAAADDETSDDGGAEDEETGEGEADQEDGEGKALFDLTPPPPGDPYAAVFREFRTLDVPAILESDMQFRARHALFVLGDSYRTGTFPEASASLNIVLSELRGTGNPEIRSFTDRAASLLQRAGEVMVTFPTKAMAHESLNRSPKANWVEKAGQLPAYIQHIANDIHQEKGVPLSRAIPMAIAAVKRWAAGGENVDADTRAKAAKAVAEWEALKAKSRASKTVEGELVESTRYPYLPGTYEELRDQLREEATKTLSALSMGAAHVEVVGTWPDRAVVTAYTSDGQAKSYEMPYMLTVGDGPTTVTMDAPQPVQLTVSMDDVDESGDTLLPYPSMIEDVTAGLRALLLHGESKAGRVLNGINERLLRGVVEQLIALLRSAGVEIDTRPEQGGTDESAQANATDSTAPSAQSGAMAGKTLLDPALLARAYRITAEAHDRRDR